MVKRIAALTFIFGCTTVAWMILGTTIQSRTGPVESSLKERVASIWGSPQKQTAPVAELLVPVTRELAVEENGKKFTRTIKDVDRSILPLEKTRANVEFNLQHRQKGLIWYSTYKVAFSGEYMFANTDERPGKVQLTFRLPAANVVYDDLKLTVNGKPMAFSNTSDSITAEIPSVGKEPVLLGVSYRSQGLDSWAYSFGHSPGGGVAQVHDFALNMRTNFQKIDFPDNTLSPSEKQYADSGWNLIWRYSNMVSGCDIGMVMPQKLQPGKLAGEMSYFAPVSLFFFFFVLSVITTIRGIDIHPMNYFFLACAFFAFHLLMAYSVDWISIHAAFVLSSAVSIFLVVTYLRLVVGMRFALVEAGLAQFLYLVLFSYAFFIEGMTGLMVTIGSIVTLFVMMQMTAKIKWAEKFAAMK